MTDRQTTLAVIIPAYNRQKYVEQSICSVLNQPCKDLNVIVVNDGSTDDTQNILNRLEKKDNRVIVLNQVNKGVSVARNNALDYCNSVMNPRYIAFLDSDDVWVKDFYTENLKNLLLDKNKELYEFEYFYGDEKIKRGRLYKKNFQNKHKGPFCSYIYSNDVMSRLDIRFPENLRVQEDVAFNFLFITFINSFLLVNKPIFVYRSNSDSVLHSQYNPAKRYFEDIIPAWEFVISSLNKNAKNLDNAKYEKNIAQCHTMIKTYLVEDIEEALAHGIKTEEIKKNLKKCKYYKYLEDNSIWLDDKRQKTWEEFNKSPLKLRIRTRSKYIFVNFLRKFRSVSFIVNKRYPVDISQIV